MATLSNRMTTVKDALFRLDRMDRHVADFEADVLDTCLRQAQQGRLPSRKQHRILCEMIEKYLEDTPLLRSMQEIAP